MHPHIIYLTAVILFASAILLMVILSLMSINKKSKAQKQYNIEPEEMEPKTGVVEVTESDDLQRKNNPKLQSVKEIAGKIEQSTFNPLLIELWKKSAQYLQTLDIKKILLLNITEESEIEIERYKGFYIESIKTIEDNLNNDKSILKQLVLQQKDLAFSGNLEQNKAFFSFFSENEKTNYNQVFIIPVFNKESYYASIIFFKEKEKENLSKDAIHNFIVEIRENTESRV